jgi:hypothetical protein
MLIAFEKVPELVACCVFSVKVNALEIRKRHDSKEFIRKVTIQTPFPSILWYNVISQAQIRPILKV